MHLLAFLWVVRNAFLEFFCFRQRNVEYSAYVGNALLWLKSTKCNNVAYLGLTVKVNGVFDDALAEFVVHVNVKVRHGNTLRVKERSKISL